MPHLENEDLGKDVATMEEIVEYMLKEFAEEDLALIKRWEHMQLACIEEDKD